MNYERELQKIEETKFKTLEVVSDLNGKLARREIDGIHHQMMLHDLLLGKTKEEIISYLDSEKRKIFIKMQQEKEEELREANRKSKSTFVVAALVLLLIISGVLFLENNGLTGFVTRDFNIEEEISLSTSEPFEQMLNYTNITSFKISGTIDKGSAIVKLRLENGEELIVGEVIATETGETYTLTTDKKNYLLGERVNITINPNSEDVSTYVYFGEESTIITDETFLPLALGEYKIVTIITDGENIARLELNFTVTENPTNETQEIISVTLGKENIFTETCQETCQFESTNNPTIIIQPSNDATIKINKITTTIQKENNAPVQIAQIPDIEVYEGKSITINLSQYFEDFDLENVYYDMTETEKTTIEISGEEVKITGLDSGTESANVYATDGTEITTSNEFKIKIRKTEIEINNIENETLNETQSINQTTELNETNLTINATINITDINLTNLNISTCDLPLEERPTICFEGEEAKFFKDIVATLTDSNGATIGRFNRFGNLIISGELIENSKIEPSESDFKIGYSEQVDYSERIIVTAWIDRTSGNLHLRGKIYEEQQLLDPPQQDSYNINNKLGITVAYFNQRTGDLYLRGNLVRSGKV